MRTRQTQRWRVHLKQIIVQGVISFIFFPKFSLLEHPPLADAFIIYRTTRHPEAVWLFSCTECVSRTVHCLMWCIYWVLVSVYNQWSFFQNEIFYFLDTLILSIYFLIIKMNNFRGGLSDISAKTATLCTTLLGPFCSETVAKYAMQTQFTHLNDTSVHTSGISATW